MRELALLFLEGHTKIGLFVSVSYIRLMQPSISGRVRFALGHIQIQFHKITCSKIELKTNKELRHIADGDRYYYYEFNVFFSFSGVCVRCASGECIEMRTSDIHSAHGKNEMTWQR